MDEERGALGFLGGSFDPVHVGHLRGAMVVRETLNLARVDLVPAAQSPLKPETILTGAHRLAMLDLIADVPGLGVDARGLTAPVHRSPSTLWRHCVRSMAGRAPWCGLLARTASDFASPGAMA